MKQVRIILISACLFAIMIVTALLSKQQASRASEVSKESSEATSDETSYEAAEVTSDKASYEASEATSDEAFGETSIEVSDEVSEEISLPLYGDPLVPLEGWSVGYLTYDLLTGELLTGGNMDKNFRISMPSCSGLPVQASPKDLLGFYLANPDMFHCSSGTSSFTEKAFKGDLGPFKAIYGKGDCCFSEIVVLMDESTDSPSTLVICIAEANHQVEEREILQTVVDVFFTILGGPYPDF